MEKGGDPTTDNYVAHTLRADGFDASEDGTGRGTPLVPIAFAHQQGGNIDLHMAQDQALTLQRSQTQAVAYSCKDETEQETPLVPTYAIQEVAVAFAENSRAELRLEGGDGSRTGALNTGGGKPGQGLPMVAYPMAVRRITPVEAERLQGFPDGWTAIPWRGKPADQCPDGPRYKALGNSMAVPVMRWIGERIAMVEEIRESTVRGAPSWRRPHGNRREQGRCS